RSLLALTATPPPILSSLSLHDALPIYLWIAFALALLGTGASFAPAIQGKPFFGYAAALLFIAASAFAIPALVSGLMAASSTLLRSEEHTSELQSLTNLVCRLLLEKKKH